LHATCPEPKLQISFAFWVAEVTEGCQRCCRCRLKQAVKPFILLCLAQILAWVLLTNR